MSVDPSRPQPGSGLFVTACLRPVTLLLHVAEPDVGRPDSRSVLPAAGRNDEDRARRDLEQAESEAAEEDGGNRSIAAIADDHDIGTDVLREIRDRLGCIPGGRLDQREFGVQPRALQVFRRSFELRLQSVRAVDEDAGRVGTDHLTCMCDDQLSATAFCEILDHGILALDRRRSVGRPDDLLETCLSIPRSCLFRRLANPGHP